MEGTKFVRSSNRRSISQPAAARIVIVATGVDAVGVAAADAGMAATRVMDEGRIAAQRLTGVQSEVQTEVQTEARNELLSEVRSRVSRGPRKVARPNQRDPLLRGRLPGIPRFFCQESRSRSIHAVRRRLRSKNITTSSMPNDISGMRRRNP